MEESGRPSGERRKQARRQGDPGEAAAVTAVAAVNQAAATAQDPAALPSASKAVEERVRKNRAAGLGEFAVTKEQQRRRTQ